MINDLVAAMILAVVQGITEWFPISSSGHLILVSYLLGVENTLSFDLALHFGTLMAVFVYFGKEITDIMRDMLMLRFKSENGKMGILLIIATIPAGLVGFLAKDFFEQSVNNLVLLTFGLGITGVLLIISSLPSNVKSKEITPKIAFLIGLAQIGALFRGISRSGSTMCAGVLLGLDQRKAAKFSFLMSIPIIFGANILSLGNNTLPTSYLFPALISFVVGLGTIHLLLRFVLTKRANLKWFGIYALIVALSLGTYLFLGGQFLA